MSSKTEINSTYKFMYAFWTCMGMIISWDKNHSFWWTLLHGFLGPFYVIYRAIWAPWF